MDEARTAWLRLACDSDGSLVARRQPDSSLAAQTAHWTAHAVVVVPLGCCRRRDPEASAKPDLRGAEPYYGAE